ncbi:MAG: hypothetical protein K1Y36_22005 [Blastocatellia bacterium]|nr:hypothetical protein [Blastocatellia bacterium]
MGLIHSIADLGFALRGMTAEGRVYYANLLGIQAKYEDAFEMAVNHLEEQASTDKAVDGLRLSIAEIQRQERQYLDFIFTSLSYHHYRRRQAKKRTTRTQAA